MARLREGDEGKTTNLQIPVYAEELEGLPKRPPMNWLALKADLKIADSMLKANPDMDQVVHKLEAAEDRVNEWIDKYLERYQERIGRYLFRYDWKRLRTRVDLQLRLFIEQVFYERGDWTRELVTGFRPII